MKLKLVIIMIGVILFSCNRTDKYLASLDQLDEGKEIDAYQLKLGYSGLVMKNVLDETGAIEVIYKLIDLHAYTEARYCTEYLINKYGEQAEYDYIKANCYLNEMQPWKASLHIQKAISVSELPKYKSLFEKIKQEGIIWHRIDSLNNILSQEKGQSQSIYIERAGYFVSLRENAAAIEDLNSVLEDDPNNEQANYLKAISFLYAGNFEQADASFRNLYHLPELTEARSRQYEKFATASERIVELSKKIDQSSGEPMDYLNISRNLSLVNAFDQATKMINSGLKKYPDEPRLLQGKLLILVQSGALNEANTTARYIESLGISIDPGLKELIYRE